MPLTARAATEDAEPVSAQGGYTLEGSARSVRERHYIEAALAEALDGTSVDMAETMANFDVDALAARADLIAAEQGPEAARQLLLEEVRRCRRWLRAIHLGLAGNDAVDHGELVQGWRGNLTRVTVRAVVLGLEAGTPTEQLVADLIASEAIELGETGQAALAPVLAYCLSAQERPELALSVLIRFPVAEPAQTVRHMLNAARMAYGRGQIGRVAELLALTGWEMSDPTGLVRELLRRLVDGRWPTERELMARTQARQEAVARADWAALRELALFDVMWLEEEAGLWQALSAILRLNAAEAQADLARDVAQLALAEKGLHE